MNYEVKQILSKIKSPLICKTETKETTFENGIQALEQLKDNYFVEEIGIQDGRVLVKLRKDMKVPNDVDADWVREYKDETGEDVSFF